MSESKQQSRFAIVMRFFGLALKEWRVLGVALSFTALATIATVAVPRLIGRIVDEAITPRNLELLKTFILVYVALEFIRLVGTALHTYFFQKLGQRILQSLRCSVFETILRLTVPQLNSISSGALSTRLLNDINALGVLFNAGFVRVIERMLTVAFIVVNILALNLELGGACLAFFGIFALCSSVITRALYSAYSRIRILIADLNSFLSESLSGIKTIHLYNRELVQSRAFAGISTEYAGVKFRPAFLFASLHASMTLVIGLSMLTLIGFGGGMVQSGQLKIGVLIALISYVLWLFWPIMQIVNEWSNLLSGIAAAERIFEIFDWPTEDDKQGTAANRGKGDVELRNVWFAYNDGPSVLKGISLKIRAGQRVAICGPTGSGKSTLLSLLQRFYDVKEGEVLLDGKKLEEYSLSELRSRLGIVQQDVFLFSGAVADNVTLWDPTLVSRMESLAELSGGNWGISEQTMLHERGSNLSMGERQYLAFLRTLVRSPEIWLVDEATAYLDPELEKVLMRELKKAAAGKTIITVAHRLSSIVDFDFIVVLHDGEIVEQGTHLQLLAMNGLYAKMFRLQTL